ncbi:MAG: hypothetical protein H9W83_00825 [Leuconostoc sp.]|nr:hypothetical protein [Leuconostoc sp.]
MVDRDVVDYRDKTPFNQEKLQDLQTIKDAILHKQFGKDVRAPIAQLPDALVKLFSATGGNANAEVIAARGGFETLGLHEQAQDNAITNVSNEVVDSRTNNKSEKFVSLKKRLDSQENDLTNSINDKLAQISAVPETFANLSDLKSKYPNGKTGIFVVADTGHKYIWSNGSWFDAGVYQSVGIAENSINPSKLSRTYDAQGDGKIYSGYYIVGYDTDNKISLQKSDTTPFNVLEIYYNKTGIVHINKSASHVFGQAVVITDLQDKNIPVRHFE